jgi:hypothetical protein
MDKVLTIFNVSLCSAGGKVAPAKRSLGVREERLLPQNEAWKRGSKHCSGKTKLGSAGEKIAPASRSLEVGEGTLLRQTEAWK